MQAVKGRAKFNKISTEGGIVKNTAFITGATSAAVIQYAARHLTTA
ncbi:hypothetical protein [uncultured Campylobacter sp.]|jgi:hypothetical protein|nr:hypothetical protein [uncultured Campylobacter sp.]